MVSGRSGCETHKMRQVLVFFEVSIQFLDVSMQIMAPSLHSIILHS